MATRRSEVQLHAASLPVGGQPRHRRDGAGVAARSARCSAAATPRRTAPAAGRRAAALGAAPRAARQARHLPVPERRPVAARSVRLQAAAAHDERRGAAGVGPHGPAAHRHDGAPEVVPDGRLALRVRAARQERRVGQRAAAAHGEDRRRAVHRQGRCTPRRSTTIPAITFFQTGSQQAGRPSHGRVALATASAPRTQNLPGVHRPALARARGRSAALLAAVGQRLPAVAASGRAVPRRQGSGAVPERSRRHRPRQPPAHARHAARARTAAARARARSGDRRAHRAVRDGVPHADGGARR